MSANIGDAVVFGFGAQGRAQALNLRDSGISVSVCTREHGKGADEVRMNEIPLILDARSAARGAKTAAMLIPDSAQPEFYGRYLHEDLPEGAALVFAHGFAVHHGGLRPRADLDVVLAAPLAHAKALRSGFVEKGGVPVVLAVHQDASGRAWERVRAYARAIAGEGPFIESTFAEEVEIDLFAEQAVLCGGVPELIRAAFDTLVERGYNPDIAYMSCLRELGPIVDIMCSDSIAGMRRRISDTARYGSITRGPRVIDGAVRSRLIAILDEIRSGGFAREFAEDGRRGFEGLSRAMEQEDGHAIEKVHRRHRR